MSDIETVLQKQAPVWQRMSDHLLKMTQDQIAFINTDADVLKKKQELNATFIEWLFEKYKNEFVSLPIFEKLSQDYVDSVISSGQNYAKQQASLKQTNDALLKEVEELRKFKAEHEKVLVL